MTSKPTPRRQKKITARLTRTFVIAVITVAIAIVIATPHTAHSTDAQSKSTQKTQTAKNKGSLKIKQQHSPSEETTSERDRRLKRECKGAPNAGACLGYTRQ